MFGNPPLATDHLSSLDTIEDAIADIKAGKVVIVVDDEDRENEGDFICAAECITPEIINFMATYGRGLICTPIDEHRADELELNMMVTNNTALHETAFTVSIDLIGFGCTTGISAYDRATGIKAMVDDKIGPKDFARPGHIFPLRAKSGGVLRRTGHTEAAIDLARLAGFYPAGVLVEILNDDGTMARLPQLRKIAERFDLRIISIRDLVAYRMRNERIVKRVEQATLDSEYGPLTLTAYQQDTTQDLHLAVQVGTWEADEAVMVRVDSSPTTDDMLDALIDGDKVNWRQALERISQEGKGLLLCIRHGEINGDLLQRMRKLNGKADRIAPIEEEQRDFGVGAQIIRDLGINKIRFLHHNPPKRQVGITGYGLEIVEYIQL